MLRLVLAIQSDMETMKSQCEYILFLHFEYTLPKKHDTLHFHPVFPEGFEPPFECVAERLCVHARAAVSEGKYKTMFYLT